MSDLKEHENWYIPTSSPDKGLFFPGPVLVNEVPKLKQKAASLLHLCEKEVTKGYVDFIVQSDDTRYRVHHKTNTSDGNLLILRKLPDTLFKLDALGFSKSYQDLFTHKEYSSGGLIIICGATGHGKSTTCASLIHERLLRFGGVCFTIEDPPEMPLHGHLGNGICYQCHITSKQGDRQSTIEEEMTDNLRGVLRSYPVAEPCLLLIGEIRDGAFTRQLLQSALNGLLIVVTVHATGPIDAIRRLAKMAGDTDETYDILASALNFIVHQEINNGMLVPSLLVTYLNETKAAIRNNNLTNLKNDMSRQANLIRNNKNGSLLDLLI